jgi:hypothetical protein
MDIWLLNSTPHWRGLVNDISAFKDILPDKSQLGLASESVKTAKNVSGVTKVVAKKKPKDTPGNTEKTTAASTSEKEGKAKSDEDRTSVKPELKAAREAAIENLQGFFDSVHWTHDRFEEEYIENFAIMGKAKFDRDHRLSDRLGTRILSICGIPWTPGHASHNKHRDWTPLVSAVTVETALIEAYRTQLICDSSGARSLRQDLRNLFVTHASRYRVPGTDGVPTRTVYEWEFADNILDASFPASKVSGGNTHDINNLMARWDRASSAISRDKKDPIAGLVQTLEKNKYLQCVGGTGTIETRAHDLITELAKVKWYQWALSLIAFLTSPIDHV